MPKLFSLARPLIFLLTVWSCLILGLGGFSQAATEGAFTSPAAIQAAGKRNSILAQAETQLAAAMKAALSGAMQSGMLEEANRLNKIIANPEAAADEPLTSLRGKAAQATYRSAVQRANADYVGALKSALSQSMKAGDLDESNRITAEIKSVEETALARANTTPGFTNLLPLIDPAKGAIAGKYSMEKGALLSSGKGEERLEIPYQVPEEYDYQVAFTKTGTNCVVQILSGNGHPFIWVMSANGSCTFHYVKGAGLGSNKTTVKIAGLKDNKRYTSLLKVRKNGVQAFLDGKLISKWDTDFSDSSPEGYWALRHTNALGVGNAESKVTFHAIEMREVTGKGKVLK